MASADDLKFMERALRLGRRNRGATAENPSVGCVVVASEADVIAQGWTQGGGRPHAEAMALQQAGERAAGATAYVTLEPCAHQGRTPPCAQALIDAGVARVVAALEDPDARVAGTGFAMLRTAGIAVETGICSDRARIDLAGYLCRKQHGRPLVTLKLAVSRDGKIAERRGRPTAITGEAARRRTHLIRARSDAILVGVGTILADDPDLRCRLPGLEARSPLRVVLDSTLRTPAASRLVTTAGDCPVRLYCSRSVSEAQVEPIRETGAEVVAVESRAGAGLDLPTVLEDLAALGVNDLMVEGGAQVAAGFLGADLVDRVALFSSPRSIGAAGLDALEGMSLEAITDTLRFRHSGRREVGEDMLDWYARKE